MYVNLCTTGVIRQNILIETFDISLFTQYSIPNRRRTLTIISKDAYVKTIIDAFTYDDVLVMPAYAEVMPAHVDVSTQFSRNIRLNAPLCSSPMDTVTHHKLAIQIALHGGIGIMDRNISIEQQCGEVKAVKRHMSEMILDPYTLFPHHTVADARNLMRDREISGIPIIEADGRLVGIITRRDLRETSSHMLVENVMTRDHLITARFGITPQEAQKKFHETHAEKLLLVDELFHLKGLMTLKDTEKKDMFPHATLCGHGQLRVGAAVGATGDFRERAIALRDAGADVIVIDTAHGHSLNVVNALDTLKHNIPAMVDVVAGNVATAEGARLLCEHGADAIRVGMGPASICTTRVIAGIGVPQLSAIMWATEGVQEQVPIIADGGIKYSGDITKAIAGGASSVMIGSLFAGTEESPGEKILYQGRVYKSYRGMGSEAVRSDRYGEKAVPEGIEGMVPDKGPFALMFEQLIGGLRAGMGYAGCKTIEELRTKTTFVRGTLASLRESHPHGVAITKETLNYQTKQQ